MTYFHSKLQKTIIYRQDFGYGLACRCASWPWIRLSQNYGAASGYGLACVYGSARGAFLNMSSQCLKAISNVRFRIWVFETDIKYGGDSCRYLATGDPTVNWIYNRTEGDGDAVSRGGPARPPSPAAHQSINPTAATAYILPPQQHMARRRPKP